MADNGPPAALFVVADRFGNFAANPSVITLQTVNSSLVSGELTERGPVVLSAGLGVDDEHWAKLHAHLEEHDAGDAVTLAGPPPAKLAAASAFKFNQTNVPLGNQCESGPRSFRKRAVALAPNL